MQQKISSDRMRLVLGLGKSGWSVASYLQREGLSFILADTRPEPPYLRQAREQLPEVPLFLQELPLQVLEQIDEVIVSPGLSLSHPWVKLLKEHGKPLISDVQLWRRATARPLVAITGSNGKSTVTYLVFRMAQAQGLKVAIGGNYDTPVLELTRTADIYVVELSSFQLDLTTDLEAQVACLLNLSPDHLERYASQLDYYNAKQRIFAGCHAAVYNREDKLTRPLKLPARHTSFTSGQADINEFGIVERESGTFLCEGSNLLANVADFQLSGRHNYLNLLAALAVARLCDWSLPTAIAAVQDWTGLPHRCQKVAQIAGVSFFNDSKATNPGATLASLNGLAPLCQGTLHLILGGSSKKSDFTVLNGTLEKFACHTYLIGAEAERLQCSLSARIAKNLCGDLATAVEACVAVAVPGDLVLLSPACASFDAYRNFAERGDDFSNLVQQALALAGDRA